MALSQGVRFEEHRARTPGYTLSPAAAAAADNLTLLRSFGSRIAGLALSNTGSSRDLLPPNLSGSRLNLCRVYRLARSRPGLGRTRSAASAAAGRIRSAPPMIALLRAARYLDRLQLCALAGGLCVLSKQAHFLSSPFIYKNGNGCAGSGARER